MFRSRNSNSNYPFAARGERIVQRTSQTAVEALQCVKCKTRYDPEKLWSLCEKCGGILDPKYNLTIASESNYPRRKQLPNASGVWKWLTFLPLTHPSSMVTAGEGSTPLHHAKNLGKRFKLNHLLVKDETRNPTGCFKDRGAVVTASKLNQHHITDAVIASEGNASISLALYAQLANFQCHAYVPHTISPTKKQLLQALNAETTIIQGTLADAGKTASTEASNNHWYNASTFITPYRHDGKGTMASEILEQLDWKAPDAVVYPVGGGVGLVGMWKAFKYAKELDWSDKTPRMIGVQAEGCAPVVRAFEEGREDVADWPQPATIANGLLVPKPLGGALTLQAIRESGGSALAVSEASIRASIHDAMREEGLLLEPSAAAAFAALPTLRDSGVLDATDRTVVIATGSVLKTPEYLA